METTQTKGEARATRLRAVGDVLFRLVLLLCLIAGTASLVVIALEERTQTKCAQASANAAAWTAVNVVARDFSKQVSLEENEAAVTAVDRHLNECLPGGR